MLYCIRSYSPSFASFLRGHYIINLHFLHTP
nr:MAG TPA: hypothetical protein [Caudoviricetes sp.]